MTAARSPVDVAVGVLIRPDGRLLLASRLRASRTLGTGNSRAESSSLAKPWRTH